jgi:hypothetical protein
MMALSTKLTLLVLVLPISIVAILDATTYYFYGTLTIEASNLLSSLLVFLLVWERLRESLSKKLEYLDDNIFLSLRSKLQDDNNQVWAQDEIRKARDDLKRYARFMTIALFPRKLLKKLDDFLSLHEAFCEKFQQLLELGEVRFGRPVNRWNFLHYLGFDVWCSQPSPEEEKVYKEIAETMKREQRDLVANTKALFVEARARRKQISEELEEFLKYNNLRLKLEPVKVVSAW